MDDRDTDDWNEGPWATDGGVPTEGPRAPKRQPATFREAFDAAGKYYRGSESDMTGCIGIVVVPLQAISWWALGIPVQDKSN